MDAEKLKEAREVLLKEAERMVQKLVDLGPDYVCFPHTVAAISFIEECEARDTTNRPFR